MCLMISESAFPNTERILEAEAEIIFQELFLRKTCLKRIKAQKPHERRKVGPENSTYKPHGHRDRMQGLCNVIRGNDHSSGTGAPSTYESYDVLIDALVDGGLSKGYLMSIEPQVHVVAIHSELAY
jgi:hypothetical protein